jgi:site-specific DNA recombinase
VEEHFAVRKCCLDELEARRVQLEQHLATVPTTPVRLHQNLAQVYRCQVERLQDALNEPEIRDEALQILRGLVERVSICPAENGLEVEIVGEIRKWSNSALKTKKSGPPSMRR